MIIYCFSGLGADKRVFKHLKLDANLIHVDWIEPFEIVHEGLSYTLDLIRESTSFSDKIAHLALMPIVNIILIMRITGSQLTVRTS